ncbi:histidine kinase dimerization/phospho-acceptor domain-containing protein [Desulfotomaculum sp. 1211_IL3151]
MAAGIGHEVRNPMTAVRGFFQMLGQKPKFTGEKEFCLAKTALPPSK